MSLILTLLNYPSWRWCFLRFSITYSSDPQQARLFDINNVESRPAVSSSDFTPRAGIYRSDISRLDSISSSDISLLSISSSDILWYHPAASVWWYSAFLGKIRWEVLEMKYFYWILKYLSNQLSVWTSVWRREGEIFHTNETSIINPLWSEIFLI